METKTILATTDFSTPARHAAQRAAMLSKALSRPLNLLHVVDLQPLERIQLLLADAPAGMGKHVMDVAAKKMSELATALQQRYGVVVAQEVVSGKLLTELNKATQANRSGLLVCGAKGESFLRHIALGSTAVRLLNSSSYPVLVVKRPPHKSYQKVLVPVDFSSTSMHVIRQAIDLAPDAEMVLLHVIQMPFQDKMRYVQMDQDTLQRYELIAKQESMDKLLALRNQAQLSPDKTSLLVLQGDAAQRILEQEQEYDCDLIVLGKHGESALEDFLLGSVTKRVIAESQSDVLVCTSAP